MFMPGNGGILFSIEYFSKKGFSVCSVLKFSYFVCTCILLYICPNKMVLAECYDFQLHILMGCGFESGRVHFYLSLG